MTLGPGCGRTAELSLGGLRLGGTRSSSAAAAVAACLALAALSAQPAEGAGVCSWAIDVAAGGAHSLSINPIGEVKGWGDGSRGQLGPDVVTFTTLPLFVHEADGRLVAPARALAAGDAFSLALIEDGSVRAFGAGTEGQLGLGVTGGPQTPDRSGDRPSGNDMLSRARRRGGPDMSPAATKELLRKIDSMTKYPSIATYHSMGEKGALTDDAMDMGDGDVLLTEKIDGTNARVIVLPSRLVDARADLAGRDFLLGSRENLLYAKGDLIGDPAQGIVEALLQVLSRDVSGAGAESGTSGTDDGRDPANGSDVASALERGDHRRHVTVLYGEVYGGKIGRAAKQYASGGQVGFRLFDMALIDDHEGLFSMDVAGIAAWRDGGGQHFLPADELGERATELGLPLVPSLGSTSELPIGVEETLDWLRSRLDSSAAILDEAAGGQPEGVVARSRDRRAIAKLRFEDYERTIKRRKK